MKPVAAPYEANPERFDFAGAREGGPAALCIHGLTSTPAEVRPIGRALAARGIRAVGPTLPGHGTSPEELIRTPYRAWLDEVRDEAATLARDHESVCVAGVSLGGLLTLALAAERSVAAVAVVGVPLVFGWHITWSTRLLKGVRPLLPKKEAAICSPEVRSQHIAYDVMPLAAVDQLTRLQRVVRSALPNVSAPIFAAWGRHDKTAALRDTDLILAEVGSTEKQRMICENSSHIATVDYDGRELCESIAEFFVEHVEPVESVEPAELD